MSAKILIVDDEQGLRETLEIVLKKEGYEAEAVGDAVQAQQLLNSKPFDIVISDIYMPKITGVELLKSINTISPNIKVILITGNPTVDTAAEALRTGAFDYLAKPVSKQQLIRSVKNALKLKSLEEENRKYRENLEILVREQTQEIRQSEERYRLLAENATDILWTLDLNYNVTYISPSVTTILGYSPFNLQDSFFRTLLKPESHNDMLKILKNYFTKEKFFESLDPVVLELQFQHKDGSSLWMELQMNWILGSSSQPMGILGVSRDISGRKAAEQELKEREENFRNLAENAIDGILITDAEGHIIYANPQILKIAGYTLAEILSFSIDILLAPEEYMKIVNLYRLQNFSEGGHRYESVLLKKGGERIAVELASTKTLWKDQTSDLIFIRDNTERKKAEWLSLKERDRASQYLNIVDVIILALNNRQEVTLINRKGTEVLGYSEEEILGKNWFTNFMPREEYGFGLNIYKKFLAGELEPLYYNENKIVTKKGEERIIAWRNVAIHDDEGHIIGTLSSGEDITDRLTMEIQLRSSERRLNTIINHNTDGLVVVGASSNVLFVNPAAERILEKKSHTLLGNPFDFVLDPEKTTELEIMHRGGKSSVVVELRVVNIEWGGKPAFLAIMKDITEQTRAKNNILQLSQFQKSIIDNANVWLYVQDHHFNIVVWNKAAEKISGYTQSEVVGRNHVWNMLYPDKKYGEEVDRYLRGQLDGGFIIENYETTITTKSGEEKSILWYIRKMDSIAGSPESVLALGKDITQQKITEKELHLSFDKLKQALDGAIKAVIRTLETKDPYTSGHQRRVADIARSIASEMGLSSDTVEAVYISGSMHDIGKISVPSEILTKPGRLTEPEFSLIKEHSQIGYDILKSITFPWPVAEIILQHHEACNGTGYPRQLTRNDIRVEARILAVADVIEAISSDRPYRPALGLEVAIEEITKHRGTRFDEEVVDATLRLFQRQKSIFKEGTHLP